MLLICSLCLSASATIITYKNEYNNHRLLNNVRLTYENALDNATADSMKLEAPIIASNKTEISNNVKILNKLNTHPFHTLTIRDEFLQLRDEYKNDDIIGFLKIEGTSINYPVLQADDNEYYLKRNVQKEYYIRGSIFLDYENDIRKDNPNTIIYGHNMKEDSMFHSLRYYQQKEYFGKHRFINFNTIYKDQTFEIFSVMKVRKDFDYMTVNFRNKEQFHNMIKKIKEKSLYDTGVEISEDDRILSLSTCADTNSPYRLVVSAKLVAS